MANFESSIASAIDSLGVEELFFLDPNQLLLLGAAASGEGAEAGAEGGERGQGRVPGA